MSRSEVAPGLADYIALVRRRKAWIIAIVPAAILLSVYLSYAIPAQYQSTATIILEQSSIPQELIRTTVTSYADQQIEIISGRVLTVETLRNVVREFDPYPEASTLDLDQKAQRMLADTQVERVDPVTLQPLLQSTALSIHYQNPNPQRAAVVAKRLADLYLTYHQRVRTESAQATAKLLAERANSITRELRSLDDEYAQLRIRNGDALPDAKERNEAGRDRTERDLEDLQRQLRTAQERESLLSIQLNGISPNLMANKGDLTDLATVKAQLADAEQRYTPDHPDVKRLRRALASLLAVQAKSGAGTPAIKADNPEYQRVASQLDSARTEVQALQGSVARARGQMDQYSAFLRSSPEVERQFTDLQRRRANLQTQFQEMQEKLKSAELGQEFESEKQGERFSMIGAPVVASSPYYPNRIGLILLGFVLGCAIAAIAVTIAESTDATVRGAGDIASLSDIPVLGAIPDILRPGDVRRRRLVWGSVSAAYLLVGILVAVTVIRAEVRAHRVEVSRSS
jgi:polysaccharide biosynthesis transport protein